MNSKKQEAIRQAFEEILKQTEVFSNRNCERCANRDFCFPEGYMFVLKNIERCGKCPELFKIYFRLKSAGLIDAEYPFKVNLK